MTGMDRRELLQRALLLVGASLLPLDDQAQADSTTAKTPIEQTQLALISAVADTILPKTDTPGAVEAGVPQTFSAMLNTWASPTRRADLIEALSRIDKLSQQRRGRSFTDLAASERHEVLAAHDLAALQASPQNGGSALSPRYADPAYAKLKELIVVLFYLSESALTHELVYEHTPGVWRPSVTITPETRNSGGVGFI
jgi:hypothetical protein